MWLCGGGVIELVEPVVRRCCPEVTELRRCVKYCSEGMQQRELNEGGYGVSRTAARHLSRNRRCGNGSVLCFVLTAASSPVT